MAARFLLIFIALNTLKQHLFLLLLFLIYYYFVYSYIVVDTFSKCIVMAIYVLCLLLIVLKIE